MEKNKLESIHAIFDYMVLGLALKSAEEKIEKTSSIEDKLKTFNSDNDFDSIKVSLFPFLITAANDKKTRREFIEFFDYNFVPCGVGIIQTNIWRYLGKNGSPNFNYSHKGSAFKFESTFTIDSLDTAKKYVLKKAEITGLNEYSEEYHKMIKFMDKIDWSINFLHERRLESFSNRKQEDIIYWNKNNACWEIYFPEYQKTQYKDIPAELHSEFISNLIQEETVLAPVKWSF